MTTTIKYSDFIIKYTELFSFGLAEYTILGIGFLLALFLLYVMTGDMLVLLAINGLLLELNLLALSTTYKYIVVLAMVLPFIFVFNYCNLDTKVFKFTVIHFIYTLNIYLIPFAATQQLESYLYVCILLSLLILSIYMSIRNMLIMLSIILVYLICHFGIFVLIASVDWGVVYKTLDITNKAGILLGLISIYALMCMSFYVITCFIYIDQYKQLCESINKTPRGILLLTSVLLFILVFSLKYLYIVNVIYMTFFDRLGLIELMSGTKNPHHSWRCSGPLKHFYREYCVNATDDLLKIQKQQHHDILNQSKEQLQRLESDIKALWDKKHILTPADLNSLEYLKGQVEALSRKVRIDEARHYQAVVKKDDGSLLVSSLTTKPDILKSGAGAGKTPLKLPLDFYSGSSYISPIGYPARTMDDLLLLEKNFKDLETLRLNKAIDQQKDVEKIKALIRQIKASERMYSEAHREALKRALEFEQQTNFRQSTFKKINERYK